MYQFIHLSIYLKNRQRIMYMSDFKLFFHSGNDCSTKQSLTFWNVCALHFLLFIVANSSLE